MKLINFKKFDKKKMDKKHLKDLYSIIAMVLFLTTTIGIENTVIMWGAIVFASVVIIMDIFFMRFQGKLNDILMLIIIFANLNRVYFRGDPIFKMVYTVILVGGTTFIICDYIYIYLRNRKMKK